MSLVRSVQKGQIPICCQLCESDTKIQWKCIDCKLLMCTKCSENVHPKFKNAGNHKIIDIKEMGLYGESDETFKFSDIKCEEHAAKDCCMFCKTCKQLVCIKCMAKEHNGHSFVDEEEYDFEKKKVNDGQRNADWNLNVLTEEEENLDKINTSEKEEYNKVKQEIQCQKSALKKAVDQYADELLGELDNNWVSVMTTLEERRNIISIKKKSLQEKKRDAQNIINSKDVGYFLQNFEQIEKELNENVSLDTFQFKLVPNFIPGGMSSSHFGTFQRKDYLEKVISKPGKIEINILKSFITELTHIHHMVRCPDNSLWIANTISEDIINIKFQKNNIHVISRMKGKVYGMAFTRSGDLLYSDMGFSLKQVMEGKKGGKIDVVNSVFNVAPMITIDVHVSRDNKIIVSASGGKPSNPAKGRQVVIMMDENGKHLTEYENDRYKEPIFTYPRNITSTSDGTIGIVDKLNDQWNGRVVVLGKQGDIVNIYSGHPHVNKQHPFSPIHIATSNSDKMIIADNYNNVLHIIDSVGQMLTYYNTSDIGIEFPTSLAFSSTGHLYVGCVGAKGDEGTIKGRLYKIEFPGP